MRTHALRALAATALFAAVGGCSDPVASSAGRAPADPSHDLLGGVLASVVQRTLPLSAIPLPGCYRARLLMEIWTGWLKLLGKDNKRFGSVGPGLGRDGAKYLASLEVAMIGTDTWAFEVVPFEKDAGIFEVHQILIPLNGIHILENMNTEEMVRDQAWEFLFTLGATRISGGVQAIVNPIAIK